MSQVLVLAKDQRLHGKSNFANWSYVIKTASTKYGLSDYLDQDIIGNLTRPDYVINLGQNDVLTRAVTMIITDIIDLKPNSPLSKVYNTLMAEQAAPSVNTQVPPGENEAALCMQPVLNPQNNIAAANQLINQLIYKNEVIRIATQNDAQATLMIIQNIDENILNEVRRLPM
ncbi:hypothetical protein PIROE2DRAFT_60097 [Piromyces sp. E2]|nr:hypothetical protein PIROE2DRAFT_60097 [Piromyces sp. E2]|eukprot:OUM65296.1 hypothetical protein PIROE2DRAFT_60097 [Piromyces sp. E2]